ncbi:MAG TPA: 2-hydroxyacid dehydrogenase [Mycobacteriales bacterium]|nr:2-hydroxyacid dehydrogenase [Mycobacteriales bacterium]
MPTRHALVPSEQGRDLLGPPPDGVHVSVWEPSAPPPPEAAEAGFWVPQYLSAPALGEQLPALPRLEVVQLLTAGADAFVGGLPDGVLLCDARGVHGSPTSEWVLAAILASVRELPSFVLDQQRRQWNQRFTGELAGRRVLVVGAGDVGEQIRRRLLPFDVTVTMVARRARPDAHGVDELPDLLPEADVVAVVVPLTQQTRGLVDAAFLARMPDGALLVNGARGPVADTAALVAELSTGRLRAALDVTDPEPLPPDHPLWTVPGLLLTPHIGGAVPGFPRRAYRLVRDQLARWASGQPLRNVVENGY